MASFVVAYSGTNVTFDASASYAPDGGALAYAWTFGDGGVANGRVVTHRYTDAGSFTARLTVTDPSGSSATASRAMPVGHVAGALDAGYGDVSGTAAETPLQSVGDPPLARFVPGEVVVLFRDQAQRSSVGLSVAGASLTWVRDLALPGAALYRSGADVGEAFGASSGGEDPTWAIVRALRARNDVVDAHPNYVLQVARVPNDPEYPRQWHYAAIGLPQAWELTTGAASVVVAVLDTGILHHASDTSRRHPDLVSQIVPGYDFISVVTFANDGDGRDPDPYDPGDTPGGQSTYHGTHVAGTIAARTNNGIGVAGVAWDARILPVRVLGAGGGLFSDVVDGLMWSAGLAVVDVPENLNPARVANLSLGGTLPCGAVFQAAIDAVVAVGTTVVVAAGNEAASAETSFPANCANVVAVGATDRTGNRAWYSNHGSRVDVMAPGGDRSDAVADGVYSLWRDDATGAFGYAFDEGTSMAAPHVAGVVALMLALEPGLTPGEVRALLRATAVPLSAAACTASASTPLPADACGAGQIDAAAVLAALGQAPPVPPGELAFAPGFVDFAADAVTLPLRLTNVGGTEVDWSFAGVRADPANPGPLPADVATATPASGTLLPDEARSITVGIDRSKAALPGVYRFDLIVLEGASERRVPVRFERLGEGADVSAETLYVGTFTVDEGDEIVVHGLTVYPAVPRTYTVLSMGGSVRVLAWLDANQNGSPDAGDLVGEYRLPVTVTGGGTVGSIDLVLEPFVGASTTWASALRRFAEIPAVDP